MRTSSDTRCTLLVKRLVSSNRRTLQQWNAYASNCMKGAQQYFTEKINGELSGLMEAFKAARLFCPQKVMEIKSTVDSLSRLGPIAPNVVIILSASSCDFWQSPWEIGSATAERAGQGEVGGCTRRVQTAWPCLGSAVERSWSALGGSFPSFLA